MRDEARRLRALAVSALAVGVAVLGPQHGAPAPDAAGWLPLVRRAIAEGEYAASHDSFGLQAPNRAHGLRTYFEAGGIRVHDRTTRGSSELLALSVGGLGRAGPLGPVPPGEVASEANRVEIRRDALVEWYVNSSRGLEQGFTVTKPPPGSGSLAVEIALAGARARLQGDGLLLASGGRTLHYGKLEAVDALGRALPVHLELHGHEAFRLVVDDSGATYPVQIDPLLTSEVNGRLESDQTGAGLGIGVAGAGDVNGDGYDDVVVGAYAYDAGQDAEGAAFVFLGGAAGIADGSPASAAAQLESDQVGAVLGWNVAGAGDVNGDGYDDVLVGAHFYDSGQTDEGAAFLFLGSAAGIADGSPASAAARLEADQAAAALGWSVAGAGDVNGDGYDDVIVGAVGYDAGHFDEGAAFVFLGSASGIADGSPATASARLEADQASSAFGIDVAGAGDVNADGYDDVVVGAFLYDAGQFDEGAAFVFPGSASGIVNGNPATAAARLEPNQIQAHLGQAVAASGDVNGDGYDDVIVGAYLYDAGQSNEGAAFVFLGSATGIADGSPATAAAQLESDQDRADLGVGVAGAGDVNADGYDDVIVGGYLYGEIGELGEGTALVFLGSAAECGDGLDNDGDAFADFPSDPGCTHAADFERSPALPCDDGDDDDWDGFADYPDDPGCRDPSSSREDPACQDGVNNDGQFGTDFDGGVSAGAPPDPNGADPQCGTAWKNKEKNSGCGIGYELAVPLVALCGLRLRRKVA